MNKNEFNEAQRLITKLDRVDSLLKYKTFYSLNFLPVDKPEERDYDNVEEQIMWEKDLQNYIRKGIVDYRTHLISELRELGVEYE